MKTYKTTRATAWLTAVIALLVGLFAMAAKPPVAKRGNTKIIATDLLVYSHTYTEWIDAYCQWAFSLPNESHPFYDETGASATNGQSGPIWYLVGAFNESGVVSRRCEVPHGVALFIPVLDTQCFNFDYFGIPVSQEELVSCAKDIIDAAANVSLTIDGTPVPDLVSFRKTSDPVDINFDDNNVFGLPAGHASAVADGYYVIVGPLRVGQHIIRFTGTFTDILWGQDVTYLLTVVPHKSKR